MTTAVQPLPSPRLSLRQRLADYLELTKPEVSSLVLVATLGVYACPNPVCPRK